MLLLGVAGLAAAPRRYRTVALAASAMAIFLSLGPETAVYRWLHEHVVVVRVVRVLSRFALVPALALAVLAGLALSGRRRLACLLALVAMMVESANVPLRLERYEGPSPAARWLAGRPGAVVYLPVGDDSTRAMLDGLAHLRPLVNGNGAFMPRPFDRALEMLGGASLDEEALRFLRAVSRAARRHAPAGRAPGAGRLRRRARLRGHGRPRRGRRRPRRAGVDALGRRGADASISASAGV